METKKELLKKIRKRKRVFQSKTSPITRAWHLAARLKYSKRGEKKK